MFYPKMPFSEYLMHSRQLIAERRKDFDLPGFDSAVIVDANSPFELAPQQKTKYGALLIHGLLDCPFSLKEIGLHLQNQGVLCRSLLLPGHGTHPNDLLKVTWQDWAETVQYGIDTFQSEVEHLFLIGYSTGAALSIYHGLQNPRVSGIVMLSPAIKIKPSVDLMIHWQRIITLAGKNKDWICRSDELDYTKYKSIPFHPVYELCKLTDTIAKMHSQTPLACPVWVSMSREDQTVSSERALELFSKLPNHNNRFLLYTPNGEAYSDERIIIRPVHYPDLHIHHFSHSAIPFSSKNPHYGSHGDYVHASHANLEDLAFGAYNDLEIDMYALLHKFGILKKKRRELTYNPDFDFMVNELTSFILNLP